jgi:hypothetical protein
MEIEGHSERECELRDPEQRKLGAKLGHSSSNGAVRASRGANWGYDRGQAETGTG